MAARLAASDYVDVQISLDGATAEVNDAVRGAGSFAMAIRALENLADAGFKDAKISVVVTRHNVDQLDEFAALATRYGATLRITRLRPSGRGADVWDELHPTAEQQVQLYDWLVAKGDRVLTGDSFFHLSGLGEPGALAGLNLCGAGRVVCLIDPVGDVYACPFAIHDRFLAGNILSDGGFVGFATCGRTRRCSGSCASRSRPAPAAVAGTTTAAAAAAWPPSSSRVCRWTVPTPNASRATARLRWPASATSPSPASTTPRTAGSGGAEAARPPPAQELCNESPV